MHLSPLQSRLAASFIASCLLIVLYLTLYSPNFALAAELQDAPPIMILDDVDSDLDVSLGAVSDLESPLDPMYEPEFAAFDRSILGRRQVRDTNVLKNNEAFPLNVVQGITERFVFELSQLSEEEPEEERSLELRDEAHISEAQEQDEEEEEEEKEEDDDNFHDKELATEPANSNLVVSSEQRLGKRQQGARQLFISANTCLQPQAINATKTIQPPPQLTLYISTSTDNVEPGPEADASTQTSMIFKEGAIMYNFTTTSDVYVGVHAPNMTDLFEGPYNMKIHISTDGYYYSYSVEEDADLIWVDSDSQGALLITHNLTESNDEKEQQKYMEKPPYVLFAQDKSDPSINGVKYSFCGLEQYAQIATTKDGKYSNMVSTGMTKRGQGNYPKQQFFFSGLKPSTSYIGILANVTNPNPGSSNIAGSGGHVFKATNFQTKSGKLFSRDPGSSANQVGTTNAAQELIQPDHGNCNIVLNLTFCDQVAYSVPSNPNFGNASVLAKFYDDYAAEAYGFFKKALAQVACEAPVAQRYSLTRNCSDCEAAYKDWLCSVTIPRCEDFSNNASYLHPRAMSQPFPNGEMLDNTTLSLYKEKYGDGKSLSTAFMQSRSSRIDEFVKPGPYKEVLPCDYLCYRLVQSCPSSMGFSCPLPGQKGFNSSYYIKNETNGEVVCNYPGSAHIFSAATKDVVSVALTVAVLVVVSLLLAC
ncbi:stretch-activated Ca2+-permeable channel component-domain-containing protein [Sordaria brevicollis]|uniref:Stretch-activated Ca2+-permeable channel component-domain-containing protein n=1 Tax=Sordaria brevicollis TaxID=83679 RepID=A0AAE0UGJ7_SORBR|nr:stretch-activated Ca2+-permeable channel component-domain-containing protein [Sordaria brevicollis]